MLKIRLQRVGRKHEPSFRVVLTDSKNSTKSGRFKEILGSYNPRKSDDSLNKERIQYWLSQGASPTDTIYNLLVKHQIIKGKKINVSAISKKAPVSTPNEDSSGGAVSEEASQNSSDTKETQSNENGTIESVVEEKTV
ncbi:MAG: 30S ribosomal protein S16 [Candidatus Zambryskibacteria bacterium CG_4_9_14_3_um_filter_42_9]|uniref:Small ribosomal subunit protein bS16 n=1 Tax=Candidatus Zambryskibacteria bacterium CG22_combo_CG10-13_8_21_14_all_42_17 TaxID=1975118 RepID=A0A2H0BD04_9BACT|nr:MAG: 30S ribosomal protein S16 [Candidatus Zambryskibacteria bacterium CG22_combo_CG10-13_8_21_14_all_42_17]PJA36827.1 MAG: 30S ribosomal protein S16 [Candidatus Zambryskibacteria bacterium CG_4_9_14_3_um_filter_42_9]